MNSVIQIDNRKIATYKRIKNYENDFIRYIDASPKTVKTYSKAIKPWFYFMASNEITNPTRDDIIRYKSDLQTTHRAATVSLYLTVVRLFFQWLEAEKLYPNVASRIKGAKHTCGHKRDYLTSVQLRKVLENIERTNEAGARDFAMFSLMASSGLRTIEVSRANVEDFRVLGDARVLYVQGKGREDKADFVEVAEPVDEAIRHYLRTYGTPEKGSPLFRSTGNRSRAGRLATESISRIVKTRLRSAGIDDDRLTAHSLRHSAATLNLLNGGSLEETQKLLRHSNISTTMIYSHALDNIANKSASRVAAAIFEQGVNGNGR